ncbi:MAG: HTTM domain-containing protein [Ekhidna sp.]|nr:HTTM domain-containing protein [Ekhidna sp.]
MDFLFYKASNRQLALLRIIIGVWFWVDLISMLVSGYVKEAYINSEMNFPFYGFEWITPLPGFGMYILFATLILAVSGIIFGYQTRLCLGYFIVGFGYVFMCDIVYTLNKFYLFLVLAFVLFLVGESHRLQSKKLILANQWTPNWKILIFQGLVLMIYFYSGISKINPDWLFRAAPLRYFLRSDFSFLDDEVFMYVAYAFTYGGFIFDLSISWILLSKKTRLLGQIIQSAFHLLNFVLLGIGSLSLFMLLLTWLLFPTEKLREWLKLEPVKRETFMLSGSCKKRVAIFLGIFFLINLLIPHRHYLTGNNVNWTEKGHRFSWRLMTRTKLGSQSRFYVESDQLAEPRKINPADHLTNRQYRKMSGETDLIIVFAHYLKNLYARDGHTEITITADVKTRMNGHPPKNLVDPDLDLTLVNRSYISDEISTKSPLEE